MAAVRPTPARRKTALSGTRLDVTFERDGKVVRAANAEVNLPNLLATVLTTTRRDRGEIPFAVGKDGRLYTQTEDDKKKVEAIGGNVTKADEPAGTVRVGDWIVVSTADPTGSGLRFGIARPVGDSLQALRRTSARNAGLGLAFIGLALIGIVPLSSRLTRNLSTLSDGVRRIALGDYSARVKVKSNDEIGRLATAFNQMAEDVERHQRSAVEQERIRRELELGRQIQHDMLPQGPLRFGLTEIKGVSVPAKEVGGDFFNYFSLADGRIALLVGDVSGKGVGAALLMANIQASLRTRLALGQDLDAIAREIDVDIEGNTPGPIYATLFVGILDPATRELRYVNAGHNPQYIAPHHRRARTHVVVRAAGRLARRPRLRRSPRPARRRRPALLLHRRLRRGRERGRGDVRRGTARESARLRRRRRRSPGAGRNRARRVSRHARAVRRCDDDGREGRVSRTSCVWRHARRHAECSRYQGVRRTVECSCRPHTRTRHIVR